MISTVRSILGRDEEVERTPRGRSIWAIIPVLRRLDSLARGALAPNSAWSWQLIRFLALTIFYGTIFASSLYLAYELRFDFAVPGGEGSFQERRVVQLPIVVGLKLLAFLLFGQFHCMLSFFRLPDARRILLALSISSLALVGAWFLQGSEWAPPRGVILTDFVLSLCLVVGSRIGLRTLREQWGSAQEQSRKVQRVAILGAGQLGASVASELLTRRHMGLRPVVFLDDDRNKWRQVIHGIRVAGSADLIPSLQSKWAVDRLILAMPSASQKRLRDILAIARAAHLPAETVPSLGEITAGKVRINRLRPVEIEDLLGRTPAKLDSEEIIEMLHGKTVLVTGAGGSIGRELCRQISAARPARLLMLDRSEGALFETETLLHREETGDKALSLVGDLLDRERIQGIFDQFTPELVFHAAAHKHVPMMESQPGEAVKNNTLGTARLAEIAAASGVDRFVLISTDKAINPSSVMGATKRLAELYVQARQSVPGTRTRFLAVRFGNVLGSSNSVVPIFRRQIMEGGPVTVTHPEVTRYFMTIPEAVGLVLQCSLQGEGGEIFMLDMGKPIKIIDLAHQMISLSGFRPGEDIEIEVVGLRPGEKLYEELRYSEEEHAPTRHPRIRRLMNHSRSLPEMQALLERYEKEIPRCSADEIKRHLKEDVAEYRPFYEEAPQTAPVATHSHP